MAAKTIILITHEGLGSVHETDREFSITMLDRFLHALEGEKHRPAAICLYTDGVKLLRKGSPIVPGLRLLAGLGVRVVACHSCLERYGLVDGLPVGEVGTMKDITHLIMEADSVVTV